MTAVLMDRDDPEPWWRSWADDIVDADEDLRREIDEFWANAPREAKVGSRHHTVAKFYLKRFARKKDQLLVRDRNSGEMTTRNIDDLGAIKNFYTFVNKNGEEDGRIEDILAGLEGGTKNLLDDVYGPFKPVRQLNPGESMALALYLSFQLLRTPRHRRETELLADYSTKLVNQDKFRNPTEWVVLPHPNAHIGYMTGLAFKAAEVLYGRPVTLVTLDRPLFITCDEPVILVVEGDHVHHLPACFKTTKQRIKARKRPSRNRRRNWDLLHISPSRPGLLAAEEVGLPISPRSILILGPKTSPAPLHVSLDGDDATEFADDVNRRLIDQAYIWVAANPEHATFAGMEFPPSRPLVRACDGGTALARALDQPPRERSPQRLSNRWR